VASARGGDANEHFFVVFLSLEAIDFSAVVDLVFL
jgi:hypothetical protein